MRSVPTEGLKRKDHRAVSFGEAECSLGQNCAFHINEILMLLGESKVHGFYYSREIIHGKITKKLG